MACEQVTLQDVCELIVDCPHTSAKDEGVGYPLIRTPNVGRGRLILTDVHRVSQDVYERRVSRAVPRQGDLILAREAPAGNVAIVSPGIEVCLGQRTMLLRPDSSFVVPEYLNYYLNAPEQRDRMLRLANGATVSHINVADIRNMPVQLPSRGEQSKVAELLNVLDDKIDLNNRLNDYLADFASTVFQNQASHIEERIALFDIADIKYGKGLAKNELVEDGYPVFGGNGQIGFYSKYLYEEPQILISCRGAASGKVLVSLPKSFITSNSLIIELKDRRYYEYLKQYFMLHQLYDYATGSAQPQITIDGLRHLTVPYPPFDLIKTLTNQLKAISDCIYSNDIENQALSRLRDTLLPKLMSGEIDVSKVDLTQLTNNHLAGRMHWSNVIRVRAIHAVHSQQSQIPAYESVPKVSHSPCRTALTLGGIAPLLSWLAVSQFTAQSFAMLVVFCQVVLCGVSSELS